MLILVRHGQTDANASGLLSGRTDVPLNEWGRRQSATLAAVLPPPALVVASPLIRAQQTAAAFGGRAKVDKRWIELDYGIFDGQPVANVSDEVWRQWRADGDFAPAGGESLRAVGARVREACDDLVAIAAEVDVIVVSHVSPIKAAIAWCLGVGDNVSWNLFVEDAAVARIAFGPLGPVLRSFNECFPPAP